ncbi:MAG: hypothetical protein ACXVHI_04515, partial [Frankiaceae bacterium]
HRLRRLDESTVGKRLPRRGPAGVYTINAKNHPNASGGSARKLSSSTAPTSPATAVTRRTAPSS